ncbi:MAG: nodulation protein NfeD [Armatimonadetes bacterium]|nr:nodulation protein NfeD [Armatimonadota bacterium]
MRLLIIAVLALLLVVPGAARAANVAPVYVMHVDDQIDPAVANYLNDGIQNAQSEGAQAVLIIMDTPGGLLTSTKQIVKTFFASKVPVIVFVHPNGSWAASAGALITMAADIAAMSPVTNIGASTPISVAPGGEVGKTDETLKRKQINYTAEYAKSIAEKRGRNMKWAEAAVRQASTLTANDALKQHVIDYVCETVPDLMKKIDGRKVKLVAGETVTLHTAGAPLEERPMGAWDTFLHVLSNPYVTLFLTLAAMYGIIYELSNPGSIFPGVVGGISVILLLYSYSVIPVNAAGFAFLALAIALFAIDLFTPTHGILTVGGIISMFFGLMMLFRTAEGFMVSIGTIVAVAIVTGAFFFFLIGLGVRALKKPYIAGREGVVGQIGEARTDLDPTGRIFINGALWTATSESGTIAKGENVEVTQMTGLRLRVRRITDN